MEHTKLWTKTFIGGTLISFLLILNYYLLMITMTDFATKQFHVSSALAGLSASIFVIGALAARLFSAQLMDRLGTRRLLFLSILLEILSSALYFASFHLSILLIVRMIHGMAYGMASTAISTVVTGQIPIDRRGEGVGYFMLSVTLGAAIGPFLGMFLIRHGGYLYIFGACTASVCVSLVLALGFRGHKQTHVSETEGHAADIASHPVSKATSKKSPAGHLDFFERSAIPISLICCGIYFCYSSIISFLTPYTTEIHLESAGTFFFIVYSIAILVTRPFTGRMFDSIGARFTMLPAFLSFCFGMILLSQSITGSMLLIASALLGYGIGVIQSSGLALAVNRSPAGRVGHANSTFYTFIDIGTGIGPFCLGFVLPYWGYRTMYFSMAVLTAVLMVLFLILSGRQSTVK